MILTNIEEAKLNYGNPNEEDIGAASFSKATRYLTEGHFWAGSMGPKVNTCLWFLEWDGEKAVITSMDKAVDALAGKTGTRILRDYAWWGVRCTGNGG